MNLKSFTHSFEKASFLDMCKIRLICLLYKIRYPRSTILASHFIDTNRVVITKAKKGTKCWAEAYNSKSCGSEVKILRRMRI